MSQTIKLRRSAIAGKVPNTGSLDLGELAVNTNDGKVYLKKDDGTESIQTFLVTDSVTTGSITLAGNQIISGSLSVDGSVTASAFQGGTFNGSFNGDGSGLTNIPLAAGARSGSFSGSFEGDGSELTGIVSSSFSTTSSYVDFADIDNKPTLLSGSAQIASDISGSFTSVSQSFANDRLKNTTDTLDGDLTVTGRITAQEFYTEFVSSSIIFESGSTQFGDSVDDTHTFTGSVNINGTLSADELDLGTTGIAEITSATNLVLSASNAIIMSSSAGVRIENGVTGSFTGSFVGDGSGLTGVDGITIITVTVDTSAGNQYAIDGVIRPQLSLNRSETYRFDQSDASNNNHPLAFRLPDDTSYTDGVTTVGTPGQSGAYTELNVGYNTSGSLKYYCTVHGNGMGNLIQITDNFNAVITGSFSGSFTGDGSGIENVVSTSFADTSISSSFSETSVSSSFSEISVSSSYSDFALTASYAENAGSGVGFPFSGSAVITGSLFVSQSFISGSFVGDGSGIEGVVSSSHAVTASYIDPTFISESAAAQGFGAGGGVSTTDTGSLLTTASFSNSNLTFTKGDDSTFDVDLVSLVPNTSSFALTASFALNAGGGTGVGFPFSGSAVITGSLLVSGSNVDLTDTTAVSASIFKGGSFIGDGSQLTNIASTFDVAAGNKKFQVTTPSTTWSFAHNTDAQYPIIQVYDDNNFVVQPTNIESADENNVNVYFDTPFTGTVVVGYGNQPSGSTVFEQFTTASVSWSFQHDLGSRFVNVQAYDDNFQQLIPATLTLTSETSSLATFATASTGYLIATIGGNPVTTETASFAVTASYALNAESGGSGAGFPFSGSAVITGSLEVTDTVTATNFIGDGSQLTNLGLSGSLTQGNFIFEQVTPAVSWSFNHGANSKYPVVTVYDNNDEVVIPNAIRAIDDDNIEINFDTTVSGYAVIGYGLQVSGSTAFKEFNTPAVSWSFEHNLGSRFVNVQVFNSNFEQTIPDTLVLTSTSSSLATFTSASTGYMIATIGGEPVVGSVSASFSDFATSASFATTSTTSSFALTASYAENAGAGSGFPFSGSAIITGSLLVSGSVVDFRNATEILGFSGVNRVFEQTTPDITWSFVHGQNSLNPIMTVFDSGNNVIIPQNLRAVDADTVEATFAVSQSGYLTIGFGETVSGSTTYQQFNTSNTWSFDHNLGTRFVTVQAFDSTYNQIIPTNVNLVSTSSVELTFGSSSAGFAVATVGGDARGSLEALPTSPGLGTFILQSVDDEKSYTKSITVDSITFNSGSLYTIGLNNDVDTGTEIIATVDTGSYSAAFFDYVINSGSNYRAGTVTSVWDGASVEFNEVSTNDIGDTSDVTMSVDLGTGQARLNATTTTNNWDIKTIVRTL